MGRYTFNEQCRRIYLTSPRFVVADLETTGFSSQYDEILEIGAVVLDVKARKIARGPTGLPLKFSHFVTPVSHKKIPPKITEITSITNHDVFSNGIPWNRAVPEFGEFIGDMPLVFHNAAFDWDRFLSRDFLRCGLRPTNEILCSMELAKHLYPDMAKVNLDAMTEKFGVPIGEGHHRAIEDCKFTAAILLHMLDDLKAEGSVVDQLSFGLPREANTVERVIVYRGQRWKKGQYDRVYFETNLGSVYFDLKGGNWAVKNLKEGVQKDIREVSRMILEQVGVEEGELKERFPVIKKEVK